MLSCLSQLEVPEDLLSMSLQLYPEKHIYTLTHVLPTSLCFSLPVLIISHPPRATVPLYMPNTPLLLCLCPLYNL